MSATIGSNHRSKSSEVSENATGTSTGQHPKKKRKQRQQFSCAECRRLKLKCDRQVPCSSCIRRSCADLCPEHPRVRQTDPTSAALQKRLEVLEGVMSQHGITLPVSEHRGQEQEVNRLRASERRVDLDRQTISSSRSTVGPLHSSSARDEPRPLPTGQIVESNDDVPFFDAINPNSVGTSELPAPFDFSDNAVTQTVGGSNMLQAPDDPSFGTLVLGQGGRSKYLGPTAASEWLRDQESKDLSESPEPSRWPSPERNDATAQPQDPRRDVLFPFTGNSVSLRTKALLQQLPPMDEAQVMVDSYYRYFAWHFDIAPRCSFQPKFDRMYKAAREIQGSAVRVDVQELALLFIIMAFGALHNLELPPNDPVAEEYALLSKSALAKADFMTNSSLTTIQTLHIMAHYHLATERGRNGDSAWPLWGLAMRLIQGMGLHRDGERWNLPQDVVEDRRRTFWESHAADIFQANCFSRPNSIRPDHIDALMPQDALSRDGWKGFSRLKFELCQISGQILDHSMKVQAPSYETILELHNSVCTFERLVPFQMRCRPALLALPSLYPEQSLAIQESPEIPTRNLALCFQQCTLAINVCETLLFLHRPYYAKALQEDVPDPSKSQFAVSYLAVVERCNVIINVALKLHAINPNVSSRHWYIWYHVFNCGIMMGTLILRKPRNPLAAFALSLVDTAINLHVAVSQGGSSPRLLKNLGWLIRLRSRAQAKMSKAVSGELGTGTGTGDDTSEDEDAELIGWRTRLIQRADKHGPHKATTIMSASPSNPLQETPSPNTTLNMSLALQQQLGIGSLDSSFGFAQVSEASHEPAGETDSMLRNFWDPMMMQDMPSTDMWDNSIGVNWWDLDNTETNE